MSKAFWKNWLLVFMVYLFMPYSNYAQSVEARITPIEMMIGEQAQVTVTVDNVDDVQLEWPTFRSGQLLVPGVEVISCHILNAHTMQLTLTSFDGNLYYLPPFKVKVKGKGIESKSLALKVVEMEVDTTQLNKFFPPKSVQDNPFVWSEWAPTFWLSLLMLLLLASGSWLYTRLRSGKPVITKIKIVKRMLPHQKAMKEIEQIKADRMVSSENQKEYYTKLTKTLRRYIEERYGFLAMEMTSGEIIDHLMQTDQQSLDELRQLFVTADLVKFAKYSTMINENDANLVNAIDFINQTKIDNMPEEEVVKPQLSASELRTQKERKTLKVVIWLMGIAVVLLFSYVLYNVLMLMA